MSDIRKIINKKGWTGKELGQIELSNMAYTFGQQIEGKEPTPLVSHAEFRKMLNTLKDPVQIRTYNGYLSIHEWLSVAYNITSGQEQQAQSNFKTLLNYITVAQAVEKTYGYIEQLPVIMTEKQYKEYRERRIKEITEPSEEEEALAFNLFNALIEATESLVTQLQTHPRKANPLKALKPKLEKELVTDPRILSRYNEVMGNGYYTLDETGERSDSMTPEEWQKAIALPEIEESLTFKKDGRIHPTVLKRTEEVAKATFRGATEEELKEIKKKYSLLKPTTFHLYEEPPKDLNKWEILQTGDLFCYYRSLESKSPEGEELDNESYIQATIADIEAFKAEFPKVFNAVLKDMRKYMGDTVDTPIEEWATTMFSWADLHRVGFYDFDKTYLDDISLYAGSRRMIMNGVAVLQKGSSTTYSIDSNGYYKTPNIMADLTPFSLTAFFTDDPDYATTATEMEDARETLLDSYYFMLGFNEAIDLIGKYFDIPQLEVFKFRTDLMANRMEAFNTLSAMLYKEIQDSDYEDEELKAKKLEVLKDFFYPLEYDKLTIPQENIDKLIEMFDGYEAFRDANITDLLCRREGV